MEQQNTSTAKRKRKKNYVTGIKVAALICMVLFFFPLCTVSCSFDGNTYTDNVSGWDCAVGTEVFEGDGEIEAHPFNFMLLIIPAGLLALAVLFRKKISPIALVLGFAQIIALLIFRNSVIDYVESEGGGMVNLSFTAWYTIDIISAGVASLFGLLGIINISPQDIINYFKEDS